MTDSPLQFVKEFERLRRALSMQPCEDLRLLLLVGFWPTLERHRSNPAYGDYFKEYFQLLLPLVRRENLHDLTLDELQRLCDTLKSIGKLADEPDRGIIDKRFAVAPVENELRTATLELARKLFYIGSVEEAVGLCAEVVGAVSDLPDKYNDLDDAGEFEALQTVCAWFEKRSPVLYDILSNILNEWESERQSITHDRANCLFVEENSISGPGRPNSTRYPRNGARGRLRVLQGEVELRGKSAATDELSFENQVKGPDDPFIGVAFDSFQAVRRVFKAEGFKNQSGAFYHAHFAIKDSDHTFTGDSIGLAVGLITYTQLLKPEVMRHERFLAGDVAFTGGVSPDGAIAPVNRDTLAVKVERAFFSPVKYLVLPECDLAAAKEHVEQLRERYSRRRRLHLIGAERFADIVGNHNVVRAEKVCPGVLVARTARKYSRMTKVQVPLLAVLLYLLLSIIYPKAWLFFDRNPEYVKLTKTGFEVLNADSVALWSVEYNCDSIFPLSRWAISDLDGDGKNEVGFIPEPPYNSFCKNSNVLFVYDYDGKELFHRTCTILGQYPGDTSQQVIYRAGFVYFTKLRGRTVITTAVSKSFPSRTHYRFWSASGDSLGWYINAGAIGDFMFDPKIGFICLSINNHMGCVSLFVLDPLSSEGVSPPYSDPNYVLENCMRGNQLRYVLFPRSDVSKALGLLYNYPGQLIPESADILGANVTEVRSTQSQIIYYLDSNFRITDVRLEDSFRAIRNRLVMEGKLPPVDWETYTANLLDSVRYWTDSGWVTEAELRALEKK
jgi:hypothetical protein